MTKTRTPKVLLVKLPDLAGRTVRIVGNKRPYWYVVESVDPPCADSNKGRAAWVWGRVVTAAGKPARRNQPCDFVFPSSITAVRP